jgi:hypothetical protein
VVPQPMGNYNNNGPDSGINGLGQQENIQLADTDRPGAQQGGAACNVLQPTEPRPRLGSKRGREGTTNITDVSPPRTRQRH